MEKNIAETDSKTDPILEQNSESKIDQHILPRGSSKVTEISLGRTSIKVKTEATPASLKQIRELVNNKFDAFSDKLGSGMNGEELSVLVAFNLAEELLQEQEKIKLLKRRVLENADRLSKRVEAHMQNLGKK